MKFYKDPTTQQVHAYAADGSQDKHIPSNLVPITEAEAKALAEKNKPAVTAEQIKRMRQAAFEAEADPVFFKAQRGEATMDEWRAKVQEIRDRFPG